MFKIGVATAAAAVGAILAITSVFAHTAPSTGRSVVGGLANAAHAASFPLVANEPALNVIANEQITDEEEAAELAAEQAEKAAEAAAEAVAEAAEAAEAAETDEDADEVEAEDKDAEHQAEHHDGGDHESD